MVGKILVIGFIQEENAAKVAALILPQHRTKQAVFDYDSATQNQYLVLWTDECGNLRAYYHGGVIEKFAHQAVELLTGLRVDASEGLIEEYDVWLAV